MSETGYSKIVSWEVWNFMSIKHARCEFDERNIINLKGYNDSGKSAMLTALKVCFTNSNPSKQVGFITDDEDYFRVLVTFDDGVRLLRDKYRNGQSLYELYKDEELAYTTKSASGALTKVSEVPEPIAQYLGLIEYDKTYLNFRSCFEKQIGVQTTGSENYKMFNTVLKSEEIATAATLLNNDKNKLLNDINAVDSELSANKNILGVGQYIKPEEITYLKEHDLILDACDKQLSSIDSVKNLDTEIASIHITPELQSISDEDLRALRNIKNISAELDGIKISPEVAFIDSNQLTEINNIQTLNVELSNLKVAPSIKELDSTQLNALNSILNIVSNIDECGSIIKSDDERLKQLGVEIDELQKQADELGMKMVRCPNCGEMFNPENAHVH